MNTSISKKERSLLKGAIRRVFSRSELRLKALQRVRVEYFDPSRPRVKKWSYCQTCGVVTPSYVMQVDHIEPIVPLDTTLESMSWDTVINRVWCEENNLSAICKPCHTIKSKAENKQRRLYKRGIK